MKKNKQDLRLEMVDIQPLEDDVLVSIVGGCDDSCSCGNCSSGGGGGGINYSCGPIREQDSF